MVFSEDKINKLFKCYEDKPNKIISRESNTLEFKENFNTIAIPKYAKTMASFANKEGGYLIFGIKNKPRVITGLKDDIFDEYDDEKFVEKLNEYFSPEIKYEREIVKYKELKIGLIYVYPAKSKPIVCTASYNTGGKTILREGAVYYRYRAKSSEIKYPDLKIILEQEKENERKSWMKMFSKIAKIGVNNLSLLNLANGEIFLNSFPKNKELFINEELLSQIKLIKEGEFDEVSGAPTLKIIGEIKGITGAVVKQSKTIKELVPTNLTEKYLMQTFLNQTGTDSPMNYIEGFCHFSVKYLPIYYFIYIIQQSDIGFTKVKLKQEIAKMSEDCKGGKKYLLERLKSDECFHPERLTGKDAELKNKYFTLFNDPKTLLEDINEENIDIQLKIILNISNEERIKNLIIPLLKKYLVSHYDDNHKALLRKAVSYIDKLLYSNKLINFD